MRCINIMGCALLALCFVFAVPYAAGAASVRIYPQQFKPVKSSDPHNWQDGEFLAGNGGTAEYYAVVNLPAGRQVTQLTVFHRGLGGSPMYAYLFRVQFAQDRENMTGMAINVNTGGEVFPVHIASFNHPLIKTKFTYVVLLNLGAGNYCHGVKIKYE